jgi:FkbM family methyltransferase
MLANLLAEHRWMAELNPSEGVRPGDIVIDCGAHVGVFTHTALARGASQVVAVEPEPSNLECLRRNFATEIATGRVIVVGVGVWDSPGILRLNIAEDKLWHE